MSPVQRQHREQVHYADEEVDGGEQVEEYPDVLPGGLGADLDSSDDGDDAPLA